METGVMGLKQKDSGREQNLHVNRKEAQKKSKSKPNKRSGTVQTLNRAPSEQKTKRDHAEKLRLRVPQNLNTTNSLNRLGLILRLIFGKNRGQTGSTRTITRTKQSR